MILDADNVALIVPSGHFSSYHKAIKANVIPTS